MLFTLIGPIAATIALAAASYSLFEMVRGSNRVMAPEMARASPPAKPF